MSDAAARLLAARPEITDRIRLARLPARPLAMRWTFAPDTSHYRVCRAIASGPDEPCHLAIAQSDEEGDRAMLLRVIPPGASLDEAMIADPFGAFEQVLDVGTCELGTVRLSLYLYGASLADLAAAGDRVSWPAARCLYEAFEEPLALIHADGLVHGALTARRLRLALYEPYRRSASPVRLVAPHATPGDRAAQARELALVAASVCALTHHPDPAIDALLEPEGHAVLRDLLLERGEPVDPLLAGLCAISELPRAAPVEPSDAELAELWQRVIALEPLVA